MALGSNLFQTRHTYMYFVLSSLNNSFNSEIKGQTVFWLILAKELIEFRKKTAECEAGNNGYDIGQVPCHKVFCYDSCFSY